MVGESVELADHYTSGAQRLRQCVALRLRDAPRSARGPLSITAIAALHQGLAKQPGRSAQRQRAMARAP